MRMKRYIKPEIQVINVVQTEQIMAVSGEDSFVSSDVGVSDDDMFSPGGFEGW